MGSAAATPCILSSSSGSSNNTSSSIGGSSTGGGTRSARSNALSSTAGGFVSLLVMEHCRLGSLHQAIAAGRFHAGKPNLVSLWAFRTAAWERQQVALHL